MKLRTYEARVTGQTKSGDPFSQTLMIEAPDSEDAFAAARRFGRALGDLRTTRVRTV